LIIKIPIGFSYIPGDLDLRSRPKRNSRASLPILIDMNCMPSDFVCLHVYAPARGEEILTVILKLGPSDFDM